jgi:aromatic ring-opening dioxygenase LigB subunit
MPIAFGAIAPHGSSIIPELSDDANGAMATRKAMEELGKRFRRSGAEAIVIAGPHGVRVEGAVALAWVYRGVGSLSWNEQQIEINVPVDRGLTERIAGVAREQGIPIALTSFGGNRLEQSVIPLDWGMITPLWFLGHGKNMPGAGHALADPPEEDIGPSVVVVSPSRALPRETLIEFGRAVAEVASVDDRGIAFVASCDWAHTHRDDGIYGFHPSAKRVDEFVLDVIRREQLSDLLDLSDQDTEDAAIDGLWQALMLHGVLEKAPMTLGLLNYEVPSYYSMIVAAYEPAAS